MKVVHIIGGPLDKGAAKGAFRLHQGLCQNGVDSSVVANYPISDTHTRIRSYDEFWIRRIFRSIIHRFNNLFLIVYRHRESGIFTTSFVGHAVHRHPSVRRADIVHLHWVSGIVGLRAMSRLKVPVVWTLRDMWPMTGGCHYSFGCYNYEKRCGRCPSLGSKRRFDVSRVIQKLKSRIVRNRSVTPVAVSSWIQQAARRSGVFKDSEIHVVHNSVDTELYSPIDQTEARNIVGLPLDKKIVLTGAQNIDDLYKGFDLFIAAVRLLRGERIQIVLVGGSQCSWPASTRFEVRSFGLVRDETLLQHIYSAADVFVLPSRMDAFPKMPVESMACGTPVVCFGSVGTADVIDHKLNGYVSNSFDPADLAKGIDWAISLDPRSYREASQRCVSTVQGRLDNKTIAAQYKHIYTKALA